MTTRASELAELQARLEGVERERDRHKEDSLRQAATIKRMGEAAEDRNIVDQKRQELFEAQLATAQARVRELEASNNNSLNVIHDQNDLIRTLTARCARLEEVLNTPEILDFVKAVNIEAAHQRERWGTDHDGGKTDADWFWLVGYLTGKALHKPEKRLHHLITAAAALANWHLYSVGKTNMRPGIEPPESLTPTTPAGEPKVQHGYPASELCDNFGNPLP